MGKKVAGSTGQTVGKWVGTAAGALLPFEAGPETEAPTELEMQGFLSVLKKIGKGVQTGINVAQKGVQVGKQLGLLEAGIAAAEEEPTELEMQSFLSVLKKIGKGAQTGINVAQKGVQVGKQLGLLEAGIAGAEEEPTELEMQSFWSVLKKIGQARRPV